MNLLRVMALLIFTIGAFAYGAITWVWIRDRGKLHWQASKGSTAAVDQRFNTPAGLLFVLCFIWFVVNLLLQLAPLNPALPDNWLSLATVVVSFLFPPLIMHSGYVDAIYCSNAELTRRWFLPVAAVWLVSQSSSTRGEDRS